MIEVTLRDVLNSINVFNELAQKELPAKVAFNTARLSEQLQAEYTRFENARNKILQKYCEYDEETGNLKSDEKGELIVKDGCVDDFNTEVAELLDTKLEINANPLTLDSLDNLNFKPTQMMMLKNFIEE